MDIAKSNPVKNFLIAASYAVLSVVGYLAYVAFQVLVVAPAMLVFAALMILFAALKAVYFVIGASVWLIRRVSSLLLIVIGDK